MMQKKDHDKFEAFLIIRYVNVLSYGRKGRKLYLGLGTTDERRVEVAGELKLVIRDELVFWDGSYWRKIRNHEPVRNWNGKGWFDKYG
jgi:hypothetical protein